jgi:hypothetical protein
LTVEFRGPLSEADIRAASRIWRRVTLRKGTARDGLLWLGVVFVLLAFVGLARTAEALWWLPFALLCFAVWWRRRSWAVRELRRSLAVDEERAGAVTDRALETRVRGVDARIPWESFTSQLAADAVLVLFIGGQLQAVLAARQFDGEESWQRARDLIGERVTRARPPSLLLRTILWTLVLLVLFLAWHFAQIKR